MVNIATRMLNIFGLMCLSIVGFAMGDYINERFFGSRLLLFYIFLTLIGVLTLAYISPKVEKENPDCKKC
jgi:hypothetical protein